MSKHVAVLNRFFCLIKIIVLRLILVLQIHVIDTLLTVTRKLNKKLLNEVKIKINPKLPPSFTPTCNFLP